MNYAPNVTASLETTAQEAFRVLSANLALNKKSGTWSVISVNSFKPGEGKTMVAFNLSIAAAKSGARTIYIDADLRKPDFLKKHGEDQIGLTNYKLGANIDDILNETDINNLTCMWTGTRVVDPVEFLQGKTFESLVETVAGMFDLVVIDTPPNGQFVDGSIIASRASGALIVAQPATTTYENIKRLKWQLENVNAQVIGIVMNRIPDSEFKSYFVVNE